MTLKLKRRKPEVQENNSGITALIDGDVVVYSCGFSAQHNIHTVTLVGEDEPRASFQYKKDMNNWIESEGLEENEYTIDTRIEVEPVENALHSVKRFLNDVLEKTNAQYHKIYLTGKGNFREDLATILPYKGNRTAPKPVHYDAIRQYLIDVWNAEVVDGMEADDMLAIEQTLEHRMCEDMQLGEPNTVICSIDKDLRQVPGWHYNWNKDEAPVWVNEEEGVYNLYYQLLIGDDTDNILGCGSKVSKVYKSGKKKGKPYVAREGVGPEEAKKILEDCTTEKEMYDAVFNAYRDHMFPKGIKHPQQLEEVEVRVKENAHLLYMIRELDKDGKPVHWRAPV